MILTLQNTTSNPVIKTFVHSMIVVAFGALISLATYAENLSERPMYVQEYADLDIEFWTEMKPRWNTKIKYHNRKPVLLVSTPPKVYPPMNMTVTSFPGMAFTHEEFDIAYEYFLCLLYTSPSPRDATLSRMPSSA